MVIIQVVVHQPPAPFALHQPPFAQRAQLVGDGGLFHAQQGCEVVDTQVGMQQGGDDAHAGGVGQRLKQIGDRPGRRRRQQGALGLRRFVRVGHSGVVAVIHFWSVSSWSGVFSPQP